MEEADKGKVEEESVSDNEVFMSLTPYKISL